MVFLLEKVNRGGSKKSLIWKRTAVTGAILAAMAAPLIVMPARANADLASAVDSGSYGPVVTIVSPQYADVVKGNSVSIDVAVQQRSNPVKALQMFVDDHIATPGWVPLKSLQSSKFNWDTTLFSNGPHKLTVRVIDSEGMIGQAEITVYVNNAAQNQQQDATAPALKWLGIQNGQVLKGVVNLQLQASANFGVKYIFVMLNSASDPDKKPALRSWMINQPPYIIPFDTTQVNDGAYVLDALAYDALSNQGEAPRLNIGIANNTINPTYIGSNVPSSSNNSTPDNTNNTTNTANTGASDSTNTASTNTAVANTTPPANTNTNSGNASNTNVASTNTQPAPLVFTPVAPTLVSPPARQGALNDNSGGNSYNNNNDSSDSNDSGDSLIAETQSSAQVQQSSAQPRVTDLPMRLATNDVPAQTSPAQVDNALPATTIAQSNFFSSPDQTATNTTSALSNEQPLTTLAETKLSLLPNTVKPQAANTDSPVLEAKLPAQSTFNTSTAVENSMRQSQPLSTLINTQSPNAVLTQSTSAPAAPQRYFQVNDAMSMPTNEVFVAPAKVKQVNVPVFPQALLNVHSAKVNSVPAKSTFTAPSAGMTDVNVSSRMTQAIPGSHSSSTLMANAQIGSLPGYVASKAVAPVTTSGAPLSTATSASLANTRMAEATSGSHKASRLMADAQIGTLPGYVAPKPVSAPRHIVSSQPLFTAPDAPAMASSRIASANISGKSWGYQHSTQNESVKTTKPQIAFLPKFNSTPKNDSFASITVSPVSTKMQVSEMSQSWPAVYQAKQHERLSAIAAHYGLPVEVLAKNNNLQNGAILTAGQKIKMPRNLQVTYNGKAMHSDVSSMLVGTTSVAAFRFLFEQQGGKVTWDPASQTVHAKNGDNEVSLTIGSDQAMINQKSVMMDMAAFLLSGRTMVPVRLFEKSLNAHVTWDPSTGRMFVAMAG
jgi:hypothetical protein